MIYDVDLHEPAQSPWTADATAVTADSVVYTADGGPVAIPDERLDAAVNANIIEVSLTEPAQSIWTADSIAVTADSLLYTADGGPLRTPDEIVDAEAVRKPAGVWVDHISRKRAVVGDGYGVLPRLEGEAYGVVGAQANGAGTIRLGGEATGTVDDLDELLLLMLLAA
jgi:hypothetical protein